MTIQDKDLLLVGVPNGSNEFRIIGNNLWYLWDYYRKCENLPPGQWEPVGLYPGLTDEQAAKCVHKIPTVSRFLDYSKPYTGSINVFCSDIPHFYSALESFASRMEALGAYIKNPMGEKPDEDEYMKKYTRKMDYATQMYYGDLEQWNNYQSRTSGQWLVLMKK